MLSKKNAMWVLVLLATGVFIGVSIRKNDANQGLAVAADQGPAGNAEIATLREQLKKFEGLVPDQAAVMTHVGYHFTNLWFAADQENWPLADFYLGEARNNIKWAVRAKPFRKGPNGEDIDLGAIAQALDNSNLTALKKAIDAKDKPQFAKLYTETLAMCYACHKASGKPYLRPHIPASPEVHIINMDPKATSPE